MGQVEENTSLHGQHISVERVQIGARMEKNLVKVLKALAEYFDISFGDLLEGIALHAFEQTHPFGEETLKRIALLKEVYGVDYDARASHGFIEQIMHKEEA